MREGLGPWDVLRYDNDASNDRNILEAIGLGSALVEEETEKRENPQS